jgi:rubredoxin
MARFQCPECTYVYDEDLGDETHGIPGPTPWDEVDPEFWCPDCGLVPKADFLPVA